MTLPGEPGRRGANPHGVDRDVLVGIVALALQFILALGGGGWAAIPATTDTWGDPMPYSGAAMAFALAFCIAGARTVRLGLSLVAAAATAPAFLRSLAERHRPPSAGDDALERGIRLASTVVQTVLYALAALAIAGVTAWLSAAGFLELAWRYLLVAAVVSLLTWKATDVL
jgi:hypothetical protein